MSYSQTNFSLTVEDLQRELEQLKIGKLNFAVQQYRDKLYSQKQKDLTNYQKQLTVEMNKSIMLAKNQTLDKKKKLDKLLEDGQKQKSTYLMLIEQLQSRKIKIQSEYQNHLAKLKEYKDKQQHQWKKKAQEFLNKHKLS